MMTKKQKKLKVLMVSAEVAPMAKVGGLADVVGSLPPALKKLGVDVRLVMPLYGTINKKKYGLKKIFSNIEVPTDNKIVKINLWQGNLPGKTVKVYFIENDKYFSKGEVYWKNKNSERFLFFSLAALHILPVVKFKPDVVHCHDYHTALITDIIKTTDYEYFKDIKTLYTIHNLNYQGKSDTEVLSIGNLTKDSLKTLKRDAKDGDINFMVQGIMNADLVNTVSPTYAREITTAMYGAKLEKVIKHNGDKLSGILNGIDVDHFNPAKDKTIKKKYSVKSLKGKTENKLLLQKKVGLPQDPNVPVVGLVSRLVWQKGLEFITEELMELDCQFVFLGTGHKEYEGLLSKLAKKYPEKVSAQILFDINLAQLIYAGSDIFLIPSRFEPCGLGQMIAMRYGTLPVVRSTGGLADTVNAKVGFKFADLSSVALKKSLKKAVNLFHNNPKKWKQMQINAMKSDFSWDNSANKYLKLYKKLAK